MTFDDCMQATGLTSLKSNSAGGKWLKSIWDAATLAERERCAKVAETWLEPNISEVAEGSTGCEWAFSEGQQCTAPAGIAAAIRAGKEADCGTE